MEHPFSVRSWQRQDFAKMFRLTYLNYEYSHVYDLFYPEHWRRGPVPQVSDVWHHPPEGRDTWHDSLAANKSRSHTVIPMTRPAHAQ